MLSLKVNPLQFWCFDIGHCTWWASNAKVFIGSQAPSKVLEVASYFTYGVETWACGLHNCNMATTLF